MSEIKSSAQTFRSCTTEYNDNRLCYYVQFIVGLIGASGFLVPTNVGLAVKIKVLNPLYAEILRNTHF